MSNNQPAFPLPDIQAAEPGTVQEMRAMARGMTLRDYFAAKAMQGLIAQSAGTALGSSVEIAAEYAYAAADAMLKAREA